MASSEEIAAWVQAIGSILAVLAGFVVVRLQHVQNIRDKNSDKLELRKLIIFVIEKCIDEYRRWISDINIHSANSLTFKANGLRHLDVPLEDLISAKVGNVDFNEAIVNLRRINADFWFQINSAADAYAADHNADLRPFADRIGELIDDTNGIHRSCTKILFK